jgi:hypothetical protein
MRSMGTFHLDGGFLAPVSKPAGNLLAFLVAMLIGVASVLPLFSAWKTAGLRRLS